VRQETRTELSVEQLDSSRHSHFYCPLLTNVTGTRTMHMLSHSHPCRIVGCVSSGLAHVKLWDRSCQ